MTRKKEREGWVGRTITIDSSGNATQKQSLPLPQSGEAAFASCTRHVMYPRTTRVVVVFFCSRKAPPPLPPPSPPTRRERSLQRRYKRKVCCCCYVYTSPNARLFILTLGATWNFHSTAPNHHVLVKSCFGGRKTTWQMNDAKE